MCASAGRGCPPKKAQECTPTPPAARDNVTGWFLYYCATGVLMVPGARCVGPECRGAKPGGTANLGYAGDLGAGTRGSFTQGARSIGVTAMDGVEIAKGMAQIEALRQAGEIDNYYAGAAKRAFEEATGPGAERAAPFEEPTPLGRVLAPGALGRATRVYPGEEVGPSVGEACRCTPRKADARDPLSGWLIYYLPTGVLLTPTPKCVPYGRGPGGFWKKTWDNVLALLPPPKPLPPPTPPAPPYVAPTPSGPPPPTGGTPEKGYLCMDPRIWPGAFRPSKTPCVPPQIPYPE